MTNRRAIKWVLTGPTTVEDGGYVPVWVSVALIEARWQKNSDDYVGPGGTGAAIAGRYEKVGEWMSRGQFPAAHMSQVCLDESGMVEFSDGRHRFAWLRDHSARAIQVQVPPNQQETFAHHFGTDVRMSDYVPPPRKMSVAGKMVGNWEELLAEWHFERNAPLDPFQVRSGSNKKVWWRCSNGHEFQKSPNGRTNNHRASGRIGQCPFCYQNGLKGRGYWSWEKIVSVAKGIVAEQGALPPAAWFQASGYAMLVVHVYDQQKTWDDLRTACGSFDTSSFVPSRCGLRWRSHPEASFSNFLFARGIRHDKGLKYPDAYAQFSGKTYGYYDVLFYDKAGRPIDVEIWGDKPNGHDEANYAKVREAKERFNKGRSDFLGIHYSDCRSDVTLKKILEPYIGIIEPFVFEQPQDRLLETTHWSNADELLDTCREIAAQQTDGKFPAEDWLRKRGKWAQREGPAYNTLSVYIKLWIGGTRKVRQLLGQAEHSTIQWDRGMVLRELKAWYDDYGKSPGAIRRDVDRGIYRIEPHEIARGSRIEVAVAKYAGGIIAACAALGIKPSRKSPKQK